jgi:hypothetical protein
MTTVDNAGDHVLEGRGWAALAALAALAACAGPTVAPAAQGGASGDASVYADTAGNFGLPPTTDAPPKPPCTPISCAVGPYCGDIGDGCGNKLGCGECPAGLTCGGGGVPKVCAKPIDPSCKPTSCAPAGARFCGRVGDGCGRALECGECPDGSPCGAAHVCGTPSGAPDPGSPVACENLCKLRPKCAAGGDTTISGTVFAPTPAKYGAADPLYGALVYVPNGVVEPFTPGVACDRCGQLSGAPLVTALTGPDGKFTLRNAPAGHDIPLVIQIGRWRRQVKIPSVAACTDTPLGSELTRLPRTRAEGDIPLMALATGTWDPFENVLRKIGVDDSEFTLPTGPGRVHLWHFGGDTPLGKATPDGKTLVGSLPTLSKYDLVLLPCDSEDAKPAAQMANLRAYTDKGGRLFLTDWGYSWLRDKGPFEKTVTWYPEAQTQGTDFDTLVDQGFPKGVAFAQWLQVVGASPVPGQVHVHDPFNGASNVGSVVAPTQRWLYTQAGPSGSTKTVQHFTFNTPIEAAAEKQCGRVVFSQFHVALGTERTRENTDPPMSPQEKALEFMLFDATSCILPDNVTPTAPRAIQPPPPAPPPPPPTIE